VEASAMQALEQLQEWLEIPWVVAGAVVVGSILAAFVIEFVFARVFLAVAKRSKTDLDDRIVEALRRPVFLSVVFIGLAVASMPLEMPHQARYVLYAALQTMAVWVFSVAAFHIGSAVLHTISRRAGESSMVQPRTLPVFDILIKITIIGLAIYFTFLAWKIDVTAWLASAGIIGIAIGFAAKDTLANLFAGIFIIADAPYKVGDFIVIEDSMRGRVTRIGMRSTRILTRDDVEITVPNSLMGNSKILNEAGGPYLKQRTHVNVSAAYGSDADQVVEVMLSCLADHPNVADSPDPEVRFREFGGSGLEFEMLFWVHDAAMRNRTIADLNKRVYKAFNANGIEIPYSKHDVYVKQMAAPTETAG